jgi:hypothetical protein
MSSQIVFAIYQPKPGRNGHLEAIIKKHVPTLRSLGYATKRPVMLLRSTADQSYLEIFEWTSEEAASKAHSDPHVLALWDEFGEVATYRTLSQLAEAGEMFPHFEAVDALVP